MDVTVLFTLILFSTVGARNIPANNAESLEKLYEVVEDNSHPKAALEGIVIPEEPVIDVVNLEDVQLTSNEESEERNAVDIDIEDATAKVDDNQYMDNMTAVLDSVEVKHKDKEAVKELEDRTVVEGNHCPDGSERYAGGICLYKDGTAKTPEDKNS